MNFLRILPLPLGWVRVLFRVNRLGADFWAAHFPRVTDAASGCALHASLPGAMNVLTPSGWMFASNHVLEKPIYLNSINLGISLLIEAI